jgi:hypothetical protein
MSLFSTRSRAALRSTHPPVQRVQRALSPGLKRPGRVGHHSPQFSAEAKYARRYTGCFRKSFTTLKEYIHLFRGRAVF